MKKLQYFYRLYVWKFRHIGRGHLARARGKCIGTFPRYRLLVREAQRRAVLAGYPKSRWMDLFDWNLGGR